MGDVICARWRGWERRADTILRNAQALMADIMEHCGPEHPAVDYADNVLDWSEQLADILSQQAEWSKSPGRRSLPHPTNTRRA